MKKQPYAGINESIVILSAVRYVLGRASYAPGCVMDFCRENWGDLSENTRHVIMRDVLQWLGERHLWNHTDMDYSKEWRELLLWCFEQDKAEALRAIEQVRRVENGKQGIDDLLNWTGK